MESRIRDFLRSRRIRDIAKTTDIIYLNQNDSVEKALQTLADNGISSAFVLDSLNNHCIGFIDVLDLTVFIVSLFSENQQLHPHLYKPQEIAMGFDEPVGKIINLSQRDPFWPVDAQENLLFLISKFLRLGIHRVPVKSKDKLIGIVSQSDVTNYIFDRSSQFQGILKQKFEDCQLTLPPIVTITEEATLIQVFLSILKNGISGLAVVDNKGRLVNNISASDLKGVTKMNFFKLEGQIQQLLWANTSKKPPVSCKRTDTWEQIISKFVNTGVHRIYVVDDEGKPVTSISLTDLMHLFST